MFMFHRINPKNRNIKVSWHNHGRLGATYL